MRYINVGTCIFCKRQEPEVTFRTRPHTIPQKMGGKNIGVDVCDECNHYFGTADKTLHLALTIEVCVKEVMELTKYLTDMVQVQNKGESLPQHRSIYFNVYQKEHKIVIKKCFLSTVGFKRVFTRCFKRGLYEFFLQEYHRQTGNGLDLRFDAIRRFARYNEGNVPVWHLQFNPGMGIHFVTDESNGLEIPMSEAGIKDIEEYGMFCLLMRGFVFYLAVTPKAETMWRPYLKQENDQMRGGIYRGVELLEDIQQVDFMLSRFS